MTCKQNKGGTGKPGEVRPRPEQVGYRGDIAGGGHPSGKRGRSLLGASGIDEAFIVVVVGSGGGLVIALLLVVVFLRISGVFTPVYTPGPTAVAGVGIEWRGHVSCDLRSEGLSRWSSGLEWHREGMHGVVAGEVSSFPAPL